MIYAPTAATCVYIARTQTRTVGLQDGAENSGTSKTLRKYWLNRGFVCVKSPRCVLILRDNLSSSFFQKIRSTFPSHLVVCQCAMQNLELSSDANMFVKQ